MFFRLSCIAFQSFPGFILKSMEHGGVEHMREEADFMETLQERLKMGTELTETV